MPGSSFSARMLNALGVISLVATASPGVAVAQSLEDLLGQQENPLQRPLQDFPELSTSSSTCSCNNDLVLSNTIALPHVQATGITGPLPESLAHIHGAGGAPDGGAPSSLDRSCPQAAPLFPTETNTRLAAMAAHLRSAAFLEASASRMSRAVRINTTSADGMQSLPGDDPAWAHMRPFAEFLAAAFPLVHRDLELARVNAHGLVYTWRGQRRTWAPTVLMAHQDVVPASGGATFSGRWDGRHVWGRGAVDCKNTLVGAMEAVEELIRAGWAPRRTVILAFGFDEEISGNQGAKKMVEHLVQRYGEGGVAVVVDEGSGLVRTPWGSVAAVPAVAEKGYLDVEIAVAMQAGHSSLPPEENSITVMAGLVRELQAARHDDVASSAESHPVPEALFCAARHDPALPKPLRDAVARVEAGDMTFKHLAHMVTELKPELKGLFATTQSIGVIQGGQKVNVVPGRTSLRINHRIIQGDSVQTIKSHLEHVVRKYVAQNHPGNDDSFAVHAWGEHEQDNSQTALFQNSITLQELPGSLEPPPVSPHSINSIKTPYRILQGTTFALYGSDLAFVAPILLPANTDSRHYAALTKHVFRFSPGHDVTDPTDSVVGAHGAHGDSERLNMVGHVRGVEWYSLFIRNMDSPGIVH